MQGRSGSELLHPWTRYGPSPEGERFTSINLPGPTKPHLSIDACLCVLVALRLVILCLEDHLLVLNQLLRPLNPASEEQLPSRWRIWSLPRWPSTPAHPLTHILSRALLPLKSAATASALSRTSIPIARACQGCLPSGLYLHADQRLYFRWLAHPSHSPASVQPRPFGPIACTGAV